MPNHYFSSFACKPCALAVAAAINTPLYFFVAEAGAKHTPILENFPIAIHLMSSWASIDYCLIMFMIYNQIHSLRPQSSLSWLLAILGPIAAFSMLCAAKTGAQGCGLPLPLAWIIGLSILVSRSINMIDGAVRFPDKLAEIKASWSSSLSKRDWAEIARIITTCYATLGYACATTDTIYLAAYDMTQSSAVSYLLAPLGAIGILAMALYWTHRGVKQISFGGKPDAKGVNPDPTDRYTALAFMIAFPVFLGALGAATAPEGPLFDQLGLFAKIVRISSSFIYATLSVLPGLSYMLRPTLLSSEQDNETTPLVFKPALVIGPGSLNAEMPVQQTKESLIP
jgi:hypothetical protein